MDSTVLQEQRLQVLARLAQNSPTFQQWGTYTHAQWVTFFSFFPEKSLEDFGLIFKEEQELLAGSQAQKERKLAVAKTRFLQRMEKHLDTSQSHHPNHV